MYAGLILTNFVTLCHALCHFRSLFRRRRRATPLFLGRRPLLLQSRFDRRFRNARFFARTRQFGGRHHERPQLGEAVVDISRLIAVPLTRQHQFAPLVDPPPITSEKSLANRLGNRGAARNGPTQHRLRGDLIHVLTARAGAANERESQLAPWNGDLLVDAKRGGHRYASEGGTGACAKSANAIFDCSSKFQ